MRGPPTGLGYPRATCSPYVYRLGPTGETVAGSYFLGPAVPSLSL